MNTRLRFGFTLALLTAVGVAAACGDADGTEALTLKSLHALKPSKDGCSHTDVGIVGGLYDVGLATFDGADFTAYLQLINNLKSNENLGAGRLNTNQVKVTTVRVAFDRSSPWEFLPASVEIPTGAIVDTGEKHFSPAGLIPAWVAALMYDRPHIFEGGKRVPLRFSVQALGQLFDGTDAASNDLPFAIDVVRGLFLPCGGGPVEAYCPATAQPDAFSCAKVTPGTGGTGGGSAGSGGGSAGSGGSAGEAG